MWQPPSNVVLPAWLSGTLVLVLASAAALATHKLLLRLITGVPLTGQRQSFLQTFIGATRGPSRLGFVVFALGAALPYSHLPDRQLAILGRLLLVAFIVLVGWSAMRATEIAATLYLHHFRVDVDDNLAARKHLTQVRVLKRVGDILIGLVTAATALMTFPSVQSYGVSLFASAGVASVVLGLAARPVLTNLIAGVQVAITQPIRLEDAVIVENEWGWVEEITTTYVVVRLWDWRRMILPLSYFLEKPFQNWTRETSSLIGSVFLYVDYTVPVDAVRAELEKIARASALWDGRVVNLQVSDARERTVELRALVSARNAPQTWDLRCEVREKLLAFIQRELPHALPTARLEISDPLGGTARSGHKPAPAPDPAPDPAGARTQT